MSYDLTDMDWIRSALGNAWIEGMTVEDLMAAAEHAKACADFDDAVNIMANTMPYTGSEPCYATAMDGIRAVIGRLRGRHG